MSYSMFRLGFSSYAIGTCLLASACASTSGVNEDGGVEPPPVWAEFDTMPPDASQTENSHFESVDPEIFRGKIIGIAFGPSRRAEASDLSEELAILNVKVLDSWPVDSELWQGALEGFCLDRVVHYNPESKTHAQQLANSLPGGLAVAEDRSAANYDLIVQLCPVDLQQ